MSNNKTKIKEYFATNKHRNAQKGHFKTVE